MCCVINTVLGSCTDIVHHGHFIGTTGRKVSAIQRLLLAVERSFRMPFARNRLSGYTINFQSRTNATDELRSIRE